MKQTIWLSTLLCLLALPLQADSQDVLTELRQDNQIQGTTRTLNCTGGGIQCSIAGGIGQLNVLPSGSGGGPTGLGDPGANGIVKRTAPNTTGIAVAGTDYVSPASAAASYQPLAQRLTDFVNLACTSGYVSFSGGVLTCATTASNVVDGDKGDMTVTGGVWSIDPGTVTNADLASMANATMKGRVTAGAGAPEDLTVSQVTTLLDPQIATQAELDAHAALTSPHSATAANTPSRLVLRDASGNFSAGTITATLTGAATSAGTATTASALAANGTNCTAGQAPLGVDATGNAEGCSAVAAQSALDTHIADTAAHSATAVNTPSRIVARDTSGNFSAGTITAGLNGNAATSTALAANGTNCAAGSAPLGVDQGGNAEGCTAVASQAALNSHLADNAAHNATSTNTASRIVARDGSGNFAAGTISAALAGNASTATALASNGSNCAAGQSFLGVDASGNAEGCYTPPLPPVKVSLPPVQCTATTGGTSLWSVGNLTLPQPTCALGTTNTTMVIAQADYSEPSARTMQTLVALPSNFNPTGGITFTVYWKTPATTGAVTWFFQVSCAVDGSLDDIPWDATFQSPNLTPKATANQITRSVFNLTGSQMTSCNAGSSMMRIRFTRDPTYAGDTLNATASVTMVELSYNRQ